MEEVILRDDCHYKTTVKALGPSVYLATEQIEGEEQKTIEVYLNDSALNKVIGEITKDKINGTYTPLYQLMDKKLQ